MAEKKTILKATNQSADATPVQLPKARVTEKAVAQEAQRTYVFLAQPGESKQSIAKRIAEAYNVSVINVRTLTRKGKSCRFSRGKHRYPGTAFRRDQKYAYVTLKEGNSIKLFNSEEEKQ